VSGKGTFIVLPAYRCGCRLVLGHLACRVRCGHYHWALLLQWSCQCWWC